MTSHLEVDDVTQELKRDISAGQDTFCLPKSVCEVLILYITRCIKGFRINFNITYCRVEHCLRAILNYFTVLVRALLKTREILRGEK